MASVPRWVQIVGVLLLLAFLALSIEAYFGPGLRYRLLAFGAGRPTRSEAVPPRVYYEPGSTVQVGEPSVGSAGQDRVLLEGDSVLLGSTGQVVRLEPGGRIADLHAADGASTMVVNLGAWDGSASRLAGVAAHYQAGQWVIDEATVPSVGAELHPDGAPGESLTDGFWIGPDPNAARVRRVGGDDAPAVRLRANEKAPAMMLHTRQPLPSLDGVLVSVTALVRAEPGTSMVLTLEDVTDGSGNAQGVTDQRPATEEWSKLTVRRRVVYPSDQDRISVGIVDAQAGDWIDVRSLDVRLGVAP